MSSPLSVSSKAQERLKDLLDREPQAVGLRLRLRTRGCSGLSYVMEYVKNPSPEDEVVALDQGNLFVQRRALLFLTGTQMDYQETETRKGFIFQNPNEKGRCGCGTSFHV